MKIKKACSILFSLIMGVTMVLSLTGCKKEKTLAKVYEDYFPIGAAIGSDWLDSFDDLLPQFNSLTAENEMKWAGIQPQRGSFTFEKADQIVAKAKANKMLVRGHALVWHSSMPSYIIRRNNGVAATKEEILTDIRNHINTTVKHFGSDIYCWDVVNEVIDDGAEMYRQSEFYTACGPDYIYEAFRAAREANPDIKLYYNDYEMINPVKRAKTIQMIKDMQALGVPIDGIGMQGHYYITNFNFTEFEKAITEFAALGIDVQITELDFSLYESSTDRQYDELSPEMEKLQGQCYKKAFEIMRKHKDKITGVTLWGIADDYTWLDNFPTANRKNYPLLFDLSHQPKDAYNQIINF